MHTCDIQCIHHVTNYPLVSYESCLLYPSLPLNCTIIVICAWMGRGWQRTLLATMSLLVIPNLSITIYVLCQCILCHYSFSPCFILYSSFLPLGTCTVTATDCICLLHCHGIYCTLCLICCVPVDNAIVGNEKERECPKVICFCLC